MTYQRNQTWVLWAIVIFVAACGVGVAGWAASQWSPEHQAEAARIEEQTRLAALEREAWIENELPRVQATWRKVLQVLLVTGGVVVVTAGLCKIMAWVIDVQAKRKAHRQLPPWQALPGNRPLLLPGGIVYHTGHGATDAWSEVGCADVARLLVAGEADAMRARAIVEALAGVGVLNRSQGRAQAWAQHRLLGNEEVPIETLRLIS